MTIPNVPSDLPEVSTQLFFYQIVTYYFAPDASVPGVLPSAAPDASERALMIVGHGPNSAEDHASWMESLRRVADTVRARTRFADVRVGLVRDDAPAPVRAEAVRGVRDLIELQARVTKREVVVIPVLVSRGTVSRDKIPADLAGLPIVYTGEPLLPHPGMSTWIESRVREAMRGGTP